MTDEDDFSFPEAVYSAPQAALAAAKQTLADEQATPDDRANALLVLGKTAYYRNQMDEAVIDLRRAFDVAQSPGVQTEAVLALAPALGKQGHHQQALNLLDPRSLHLTAGALGQLHNQRSIIFSEIGRLHEATEEGERALPLFRDAGDVDRECRALINLGAFASMRGELDVAEAWYAQGLEKATETSQHVSAACIEGNLGYIYSRRGRFAQAITWYEKARQSFAEIGGVDLLGAVLELDYSRTLLDIGLANDALAAAEAARASAASGTNRMLEMQACVLAGEALIELGELVEAGSELAAGNQLATALDIGPWQLRCVDLEARRRFLLNAEDAPLMDTSSQFLAAGWVREAHVAGLRIALRLAATEPAAARETLLSVQTRTRGLNVDPLDEALAEIVLATLEDEHDAAYAAFVRALDRLVELRDLLGSAETRGALSRRSGPLLATMLPIAMRSSTPAARVLEVLERVSAVTVRTGRTGDPQGDETALVALRDGRVRLDEAKLNSGDIEDAHRRLAELEAELLRERRARSATVSDVPELPLPSAIEMPDDTTFLTYTEVAGQLIGLRHDHHGTAMFELGDVSAVRPVVRAQQAALRRFADERRARDAKRSFDRLARANESLDRLLVAPMNANSKRIVIAPGGQFGDVSWVALPSIQDQAITLTHCLGHWATEHAPLDLTRHAFLGGPGLNHAVTDREHLRALFGSADESELETTCDNALSALTSVDFAHIAAHGEFRSDNPFFSSILFTDGPLSILQLSELARVPQVVVLASCDAAAHAANSANVVLSTATELRQLGAKVVIAPSVSVSDVGASEFFGELYGTLATGKSLDDSMLRARQAAADHSDPRYVATAMSIQMFGGQLTRRAVRSAPA